MWKPPQRIKYSLPTSTWPTAAEASAARWFQPINVGSLRLKTRTWVPAMVPWRATESGEVTEDVLQWYERFAEGRPGAIVVEATGIRDVPSGPLLRIGHDRFVEGLTRLVERVRAASEGQTKLFLQLIDFLAVKRRPEKEVFLRRFLPLRDVYWQRFPEITAEEALRVQLLSLPDAELDVLLTPRDREDLRMGFRERVTDTEKEHIQQLPEVLPELFAAAALRAEQAGFDGVELHYAHAYTMASFLSARNTRSDGYGTSLEGRVRLPCEVFRAVRAKVSPHVVVGCRFLSEECIDGGSTLADALYFAKTFAREGVDFLSLSRGGKFDDAKQPAVGAAVYPYTGPSGYECMPTIFSDEKGPFGRNIDAAAAIRRAIREEGYMTPTVVAGGICDFAQAEGILAREEADIVAAARQTLADPDWFLKIRLGRGHEVRRCHFTNYCEGLDQKHKKVTCKLWDRSALTEPDLRIVDGRRLVAPRWQKP